MKRTTQTRDPSESDETKSQQAHPVLTETCERFFVDENDNVIDRFNPGNATPYESLYRGEELPAQSRLREIVLGRRLDALAKKLVINMRPKDPELSDGWLPGVNREALGIAGALFEVISASALNAMEPALTSGPALTRPPQGNPTFLHEITSLSLFVADVERLLLDLYGDESNKAHQVLMHAVLRITEEFSRYLRTELWREHVDAKKYDYIFGYALPEWAGLSSSDHGRALVALDRLKNRVRTIQKGDARHGEYTKEFAKRFAELIVQDDKAERQ